MSENSLNKTVLEKSYNIHRPTKDNLFAKWKLCDYIQWQCIKINAIFYEERADVEPGIRGADREKLYNNARNEGKGKILMCIF